MANEQKENVTTILNMAPADAISDRDVLYLLQGSGSDRDRRVTVGELLKSVNEKIGSVKIDYSDVTIAPLYEKVTDNGDLSFKVTSESKVVKLKPLLKDGVVKEAHLGTVLKGKINTVTNDRLADGAVTTAKLADNSVVAQKMGLFDISKDESSDNYALWERPGELGNVIILYSSTGSKTIDFNPTGSPATGYTKVVSNDTACMFVCLGANSDKSIYYWSPIGGV